MHLVQEFHARRPGRRVRQEENITCAHHGKRMRRRAAPSGASTRGRLPLALAGVQRELLTAPGADRQLVLGAVEDIQEQVALPRTASERQRQVQSLPTAQEESDSLFLFPEDFPRLGDVGNATCQKCQVPLDMKDC